MKATHHWVQYLTLIKLMTLIEYLLLPNSCYHPTWIMDGSKVKQAGFLFCRETWHAQITVLDYKNG